MELITKLNLRAEHTGGGGTDDHSQLQNLDFENSGHTGFQATIEDLDEIRSGAEAGATAVQDEDYVHTDNNFTDAYKNKIDANDPVIITVLTNTTINGYQVPSLTTENIQSIYNGIVAGKEVVVVDATETMHFKVNQADSVADEIFISFLYFDIMILQYDESGTITYKEISSGGGESDILKWTPSQTSYTDNKDIRDEIETLIGASSMLRNEYKVIEVQRDFTSNKFTLIEYGTSSIPRGTGYNVTIKKGTKFAVIKEINLTRLYVIQGFVLDSQSNNLTMLVPTSVQWAISTNRMYFYSVPYANEYNLFISKNNGYPWTPDTNYGVTNKKYVDDKPKTYAGYDASKTQVLKNVNGTLTWFTEE